MTTTLNLEQHKINIIPEDLPRSFQDAVHVSRFLGIQYLWIDALCIVQDNEEDWLDQAPKMSSIYYNSVLTICSLHGSHADTGLFSTWSSHNIDSLSCRVVTHRPPVMRGDTSNCPLVTRGWTFQERFLSPRLLYFGRDELSWECADTTACECKTKVKYSDSMTKGEFYSIMLLNTWAEPDGKLAKLWRTLVQDYSGLGLTVEYDKLPALAGIANFMKRAQIGPYLAGLWKYSFSGDLLWHIDDKERQNRTLAEAKSNRAPSWSWASVSNKVAYRQDFVSMLTTKPCPRFCEIIDVSCVAEGKMASGYVQLRCPKVEVCNDLETSSTLVPGPPDLLRNALKVLISPLREWQVHFDTQEIFLPQGAYYLVKIAESSVALTEECLLLRQLRGSEAMFGRVGLVSFEPSQKKFSWLDPESIKII
jgi:hypothetical protein